ncbi:prolipoprotein diacylglyceryl transferase [uncultured Muribaculum sp.]|jgi:prolipoprotein diacylglyceryl transferase|uniref:prolipoprotein diacylglyceryl transferase n=1 Tax=uncultured Muribaculum sp. TaxID=1918613 RepID=UPI001A2604D0|nr:prolipoprotein diacylglyceryl transferase [uncultured Muribaculum sp.]MBJ2195939.1 prolipoprotein diacylglyceryl transferase [Muribaculaceae bacterium]
MLDAITWTANPILFNHGVTIRWYGVMFIIGFFLGYKILARIFRHEGAYEKWVGTILVYLVISTIVGARLGHVFFYAWDYYSQHPIEILYTWEGGLASHGATIGIFIAMLLYSLFVTKKSPLWILDRLVIPIALVGALVRIGNLLNHEIYGHPTDLPWGFRFVVNLHNWMNGAQPIFSLPSHPTQIYEALCYLALFGLLMWMYWKKNAESRPGLLFGVFFVILFASRFLIEFVKNPQEAFEVGMTLNMGQWLSIPFIIAGICLIIYALVHPPVKLSFPNKFAEQLEGNAEGNSKKHQK